MLIYFIVGEMSQKKNDNQGIKLSEADIIKAQAAEIKRLKKALASSKMDSEILKEAIGIFSKRDGKSTNL